MKRPSTPRTIKNLKPRRERKREGGQILVLFVLAIVALMGFTALVIDVGVLRNANQNLWNALDAGTLAGARELPADSSNASTIALQYANDNFPGGLPPGVTVGFRCVVGSVGGVPRATDIPAVCDPGANGLATAKCNATICSMVCVPAEGDICNTIVLEGTASVNYNFGRAVGVASGTTKDVLSAACKGPCGVKPSEPVDLMLVVDRTSSMNGIDTINARNAADSVRKQYNPLEQWLGFGMLGPSQSGGGCITQPDASIGTANLPADLQRWVPVGLSGAGSPNQQSYGAGSALANAISCYINSSTGTDLSDPITTAAYELIHHGRDDVIDGIILMSDGQPNNSTTSGPDYCAQSDAAATAAKGQGIEVFTIGFGLDGSNNATCPDTSGFWQGKKATAVLASMATDSDDDLLCTDAENDDEDHFFCLPKTAGVSTDLTKLFKQAANALVGGTKLIQLPT